MGYSTPNISVIFVLNMDILPGFQILAFGPALRDRF